MFSSQNSQVSSAANYIEDVFSTYLYTGTGTAAGSTQTITNGIDLAGKGGMVWIKDRAIKDHFLFDTNRGPWKYLRSNTTDAQPGVNEDALSAFNSNGFTLTGDNNVTQNGQNYVSWTFREQAKFFDVVTYTGNGLDRTIAHNLGSVPGCVIVKCTSSGGSATYNWVVWHRSLASNEFLQLNTTDQKFSGASVFNTTSVPNTSTTFSVGTNAITNQSGQTYVAYLFAHDAGGFGLTGTDNVISCGSYTGNGSATGPTVTLGYEPQWLLTKRTDLSADWQLVDTMRGMSSAYNRLFPNSSAVEDFESDGVTPTATGFKLTGVQPTHNASGGTYIYIAIRRGPMKVPTSGTSVFNTLTALNSTTVGVPRYQPGFSPDMTIIQARGAGFSNYSSSRLLNGTTLTPQTSAAEVSDAFYSFSFQNGFGANGSGTAPTTTSADWFFKRAPSFFDVVCYTGTGSARTVTHNLGVAPELVFIKQRSNTGGNWFVGSQFSGTGYNYSILNSASSGSAFLYTDGIVYNAAPTTTTLSLSNSGGTNGNTQTYVAYLFATCAGVSKVGSYTGNGSSQTINCGFTSGARFILIRKTNDTQSWYVFDSARGIVSGNDPVLLLNTTDSEFTTYDSVDPNSTGFVVNSDLIGLNDSGGNYIFLAIA